MAISQQKIGWCAKEIEKEEINSRVPFPMRLTQCQRVFTSAKVRAPLTL